MKSWPNGLSRVKLTQRIWLQATRAVKVGTNVIQLDAALQLT